MNLSGHLFVLFSASFSHRPLHGHPFKCPPQLLPQGKQCSAEACQLFVQEKHSVFGHCSKVGPQREGKITILVLPFSLPLWFYFYVVLSFVALLLSFWISYSLTRPETRYHCSFLCFWIGHFCWRDLMWTTLSLSVLGCCYEYKFTCLTWLDCKFMVLSWLQGCKTSWYVLNNSFSCSCVLIMKKDI